MVTAKSSRDQGCRRHDLYIEEDLVLHLERVPVNVEVRKGRPDPEAAFRVVTPRAK